MDDFSTQIRDRREACKLSRRELAKRLKIEESQLRKVETRRRNPSVDLLRDMAREFRHEGQPFDEKIEAFLGVAALAPTGS